LVIDDWVIGAVERPWKLTTRVLFRLSVVYFSLYVLTTQMLGSLLSLPGVEFPELSALPPVRTIITWVALHVFRVTTPLVLSGSGSGDKTSDWVHAFCVLVISLVATVIWSGLDRRRGRYPRLHAWFTLFARFALGSTMVGYGMVKAVPLQMPAPSLARLIEPYGQFSPMGVLWASVGASRSYEIVIGCMELLGGVLLFVPRTATLGALICLVDTVQIFTLNMTYDVPVKLFSFHLIVLSLILLAPRAPLLAHAIGLVPAPAPSREPSLLLPRRRLLLAAQIVFGLYLIGVNLHGARQAWTTYGAGAPKSPLYGIWNVDQLSIDGHVRSPLVTDSDRWRRVLFDRPGLVAFQRMDDSLVYYAAKIDQTAASLTLTRPNSTGSASLHIEREAPDRLMLDGTMDGHTVHMELRRTDTSFPLVTRGFHWVQEYPFNR
jgi:hypothetical protein